MIVKMLPALLACLVLQAGCGDVSPADGSSGGTPEYDLVKVDSIGVELGDSNYVFGAVIDAVVLTDGRIALLDIFKQKVSVFSHEGEFIGCAGSGGSGPGQFTSPYSIAALSGGGFAVADVQLRKVVFFDSSLAFSRELGDFTPAGPLRIQGGPEGSIIGSRMNYYFDEEEGTVYSGSEYGRWRDSLEPALVYLESYALHTSDDHVFYTFASSGDGGFFCAPVSETEYVVTGFDPVGDTLFTTELPWSVTPKTQEELDAARPHMVIPGPGSESTSSELSGNWKPDSLRNAARVLGVDNLGRLWVRSGRGTGPTPCFDLFDCEDGSLLMSIETSLPVSASVWAIRVTESGILGWDHNPSDYPRVYLLELVER